MEGLDPERVVSVFAESTGTQGSGYLIDDHTVLTAGHVVGPPGTSARVRCWRRREGQQGYDLAEAITFQVAAGLAEPPAPGRAGPGDYAILTSDVPVPGKSARRLPRFGRIIGGSPVPAETLGFPTFQMREGAILDAEHARGTVSPWTGSREPGESGRFLTFDVLSGTPVVHVAGASLWQGASGSPLFSGPHLIGVLVEDHPTVRGRLRAIDISNVLDRASDRQVLAGGRGQELLREPVWQGGSLLDPAYEPLPVHWSVADLLQPRYNVVPFQGREQILGELEEWCTGGGASTRLRLLSGKGTVGKTRLARELCAIMQRRGWVAGLISPVSVDFRSALTLDDDRLLVVDDAEARVGQIDALVADRQDGGALRILAVSREGGAWWDAVKRRYDSLADRNFDLRPPTVQERRRTYLTAVDVFEDLFRRRAEAAPDPAPSPGATADAVYFGHPAPEFQDDDFESYLLVLVQAVLDARIRLGAQSGEAFVPGGSYLAQRGDSLLDYVVELELAHWKESARQAGVPTDPALLERVVTVSSLAFAGEAASGEGESEAARRLTLVPDLCDERQLILRSLARWQHARASDYGYLRGLKPHRLAEHLVSRVVQEIGELPAALLAVEDGGPGIPQRQEDRAAQAARTLTLLTRVAARGGTQDGGAGATDEATRVVRASLELALERHSAALIRLASRMSDQETGQSGDVTGKALAGALEHAIEKLPSDRVTLSAMQDLDEDCPDILLGLAVEVAQRCIAYYQRHRPRTPQDRADEAEALKRLSHYLADSGQRRRAHEHAWEAVHKFRSLVRVSPDHRLDLAHALSNLGVRLYEIGHPAESLDPTRECVEIYEQLREATPDRWHHVYLANALSNRAACLRATGRWREGLQAAQSAYDLVHDDLPASGQERGVQDDEDLRTRRTPNLDTAVRAAQAYAARTLARQYAAAGLLDGARQAAEEACDTYGALSRSHSRRWIRDYAQSLTILGRRYSQLASWTCSLQAHADAVAAYESLEQEYREAVRYKHADALRSLADAYRGASESDLENGEVLAPVPRSAEELLSEERTGRGSAAGLTTLLPEDVQRAQGQRPRLAARDCLERGLLHVGDALKHFEVMSPEDKWARRPRRAAALRLRAALELRLLEMTDGAEGAAPSAVAFARNALALYQQMADTSWQGRLETARTRAVLGNALAAAGEDAAAHACYGTALEELRALNEEEPGRFPRELAALRSKMPDDRDDQADETRWKA